MTTTYISRYTGQAITEYEHVVESVVDILTTPKRSRPRLMEYGTDIHLMIDRNVTQELISDLRMEMATALSIWEPRVEFTRIVLSLDSLEKGTIVAWFVGRYKPTGEEFRTDGLNLEYRSIVT